MNGHQIFIWPIWTKDLPYQGLLQSSRSLFAGVKELPTFFLSALLRSLLSAKKLLGLTIFWLFEHAVWILCCSFSCIVTTALPIIGCSKSSGKCYSPVEGFPAFCHWLACSWSPLILSSLLWVGVQRWFWAKKWPLNLHSRLFLTPRLQSYMSKESNVQGGVSVARFHCL